MKRLRVKAKCVRGDDGCYDLTISSQSYGIRLSDEIDDYVDITPDMWERLVEAVTLENVPEPWERVRDAALASAAVLECEGAGRHRLHMTEDGWRKVAADLGLESEGES